MRSFCNEDLSEKSSKSICANRYILPTKTGACHNGRFAYSHPTPHRTRTRNLKLNLTEFNNPQAQY